MEAALEHVSYAELVARAATPGLDRDAETEVCRRFAPRIRLYGLKHLRDDDRAADLVQRVLVTVLEALRAGRIEEPEHLDRFVLGTCRNIASRVRIVDARTVATEPATLESLDAGVVVPPVDAVDIGALMRCLGGLEMRAQTVLHLSFFRDKSADEIATVLETTPGNVRVLRHRAMAQVRDCMEACA